MKSLLDAVEYNAATERVNSALQLLRDEMKTLRHQDVTLMRQFLTMNDTIRSISKYKKNEERCSKLPGNTTSDISSSLKSTTTFRSRSLLRQQNVPRYCGIIPEVRERTWSDSTDDSLTESLNNCWTTLNDYTCGSDISINSDVYL